MPGISQNKKRTKSNLLKNRITDGAKKPAREISSSETPVVLPAEHISSSDGEEPVVKPPLSDAKLKQLADARKIMAIKKPFVKLQKEADKKAVASHMKFMTERRKNPKISLVDDDQVLTDASNVDQPENLLPLSSQISVSPVVAKTLIPPEQLTPSGLYRRKKAQDEVVKETLGTEYRITNSPKKRVSVGEASALKATKRLTHDQYDGLPRTTFPSLSTLKRHDKQVIDHHRTGTSKGFAAHVLYNFNLFKEFSNGNVRVNIGGDKGSDTMKMCYYFVDVDNTLSTKNLYMYNCYVGDEDYSSLKPIMDEIEEGIEILQNGSHNTSHGSKTFTCYFIADCKMSSTTLGIQGGSATCPCMFCTIPSNEWSNIETIPDAALRNIEALSAAGKEVEKAADDMNARQLTALKRDKKSVNRKPMLMQIPINRYVPPVVHICIAAVNSIIKYCKNNEAEDAKDLLDEIKKIGVITHQGTSEYNGPNSRKILKYFVDHPDFDTYGVDLFRAFAKVESFAVAKDLDETQIDEMDKSIKEIFTLIDNKYPGLPGKKTKLHVLKHHVMPFVREHKSWGKFSEQSIESIHHVKNDSDRRFHGNSEEANAKKITFFENQHILRNLNNH